MKALLAFIAVTVSFGCAGFRVPNYDIYRENMPTSIVVLPPPERTLGVGASYEYLSTLVRPLAERGYYVFPPALVASMLRERGLPTPFEMRRTSPAELREIFGADAALYVTLESWGSHFESDQTVTEVEVSAQLVSLTNGVTIWQGGAGEVQRSGGRWGWTGTLVGALVTRLCRGPSGQSLDLAKQLNIEMFHSPIRGLLRGPLHPSFEEL